MNLFSFLRIRRAKHAGPARVGAEQTAPGASAQSFVLLLASMVLLAASCALFAGATHAWFTQSIVSKGNTITAATDWNGSEQGQDDALEESPTTDEETSAQGVADASTDDVVLASDETPNLQGDSPAGKPNAEGGAQVQLPDETGNAANMADTESEQPSE
ncbi:MAG: SipW-dependent-type signal peptide-containing protein [Eggerthellaceae bacterium]|nr:SipW-dependent-type signal peptide-containing protein [Eggerthellaceae bacterium]